jgi:GH18 family chitinase
MFGGLLSALIFLNGSIQAASANKPEAPLTIPESEKPTFLIIGYLPDYRVARFDPEDAKLVTDLIYFAVEPSAAGDAGLGRIKPESLALFKRIKAKYGTRLHLCLGGWNRSKGFPQLAASAEARKRLIAQLTDFCRTNGFDGVDVDWEHPTKPNELRDHAKLLTEMHLALSPHKLSLSIALAGWQELSPEAIQAVDFVHLMAYDTQGKHSTLEFAKSDLDRLVKKGLPFEKICLGVPFYGRKITDPARSMTYGEIVNRYHPPADVNEVDGIYFNGPALIEQKTKLALARKLAGIMIWELGQDAAGDAKLLPTIRKVIDADAPK